MEALSLDMIQNFNFDYLHVCLLGGVKKKLKILLNKKTDKSPLHITLRQKNHITNFKSIEQITSNARKTHLKFKGLFVVSHFCLCGRGKSFEPSFYIMK